MTRRRKPRNRLQSRLRRQMRCCCLYRWDSLTKPGAEDFKINGPYSEDKNYRLMETAVTTRQRWLCVITAYFIDENKDYYEEVLTFPPFGPLKFNEEPEAILEIIDAAVLEAKKSGKPEHYRDTCIALYLYTPQLEQGFEDTEGTIARAELRASVIEEILQGGYG